VPQGTVQSLKTREERARPTVAGSLAPPEAAQGLEARDPSRVQGTSAAGQESSVKV